ncbi:type I glyceraldehyde-3-phosphate dehydrogenase [Candidatus Ornithobacterium hominis]|uniref:type I glyceraldehyde-3-phosphate dehydrogenase n=1 Tax=Candidatus Ornithobacterium hominis TaxID=2497989 RepID=UPI000E5B866F|nr:type I glyceraldehyde-3-phosphate dehydrogenase [Candidatus Ornithobacterium hominis]CAI9429455.1 type I glyceraldehyde-3-phosphate dehydrogenase [Candidatus Ornithobacterium hominis]SZD73196.1 Glyceraldehyde-3-phosphate dehydrogenase [Candidatus Ornithobacterium hominis]
MAKVKVAINGFGRIGRLAFRLMEDDNDFDIVAINDLTDAKTLGHLLKYDSTQGKFKTDSLEVKEDKLIVDGREITIYSQKDPEQLPWEELGIDVVLECTGFFRTKEAAEKHIKAGAKKVIISAPAKGDMKTIVYNVNHDILDGSETVLSGASCTTNCLAPVAKVLNDKFGLLSGLMTTVHGYTNDQNTLDGPHSDLRRARAAAANIVPTTTGAAAAVGLVLPELKGKLDGMALRVPVPTGSLVDLTARLNKKVTKEDVNNAIIAAADGDLKDTLGYTDEPIVSSDIIGITYGSYFDLLSTEVLEDENGEQLVKIITWYDNEMSYTAQLVRLTKHFAELIS